jgi:hypothetical protein
MERGSRPISYARTEDGIDIAYTITGNGPRDVVMIHGFTTHLDLIEDLPWHTTWDRSIHLEAYGLS